MQAYIWSKEFETTKCAAACTLPIAPPFCIPISEISGDAQHLPTRE